MTVTTRLVQNKIKRVLLFILINVVGNFKCAFLITRSFILKTEMIADAIVPYVRYEKKLKKHECQSIINVL